MQANQQPFVGAGPSPDGVDLPLGLANNLAQDPAAMQTFAAMSTAQKANMVSYIQGATSGKDAKQRIADTLSKLRGGQWN